jgi:hypothetical protein
VRDLSWTEKLVFAIIVVCALGMGLAPGPILNRSAASVDALLESYRGRLVEARANPTAAARMVTPGGAARKVDMRDLRRRRPGPLGGMR